MPKNSKKIKLTRKKLTKSDRSWLPRWVSFSLESLSLLESRSLSFSWVLLSWVSNSAMPFGYTYISSQDLQTRDDELAHAKNEYARLRANLAAADALSGQTQEQLKATKNLSSISIQCCKAAEAGRRPGNHNTDAADYQSCGRCCQCQLSFNDVWDCNWGSLYLPAKNTAHLFDEQYEESGRDTCWRSSQCSLGWDF